MAAADIKAGRAYVELYVKNREFLRGLRNARERVKQFAADLRATGQILASIGGASLLGIGLVSKRFADFDDQMRAVKAVTQASQGEFEKLTKTAKDLGASTSYTAVEVAGLMAELGRAGFVPDQINEMTGAVLDLARATGTDAVQSAGIMSATIRQFNLEASDAARVADGLTAAANGSFNTVEALGEALSYAGTTAADMGVPLEETLALLGSLGNVGIQGSNAGTALRRLLTLTSAEADKLKEIFGVAFVDAAGNARPLVDALDEVNKATANLGSADRAKKFNEAFGLLGITGASAISKNAQSTKELLTAIQAAGGQASKTAKEMDSGLGGALRKTMSVMEGVGIAIGEAVAKPLAGLLDIFGNVAAAARKWIEENQKIVLVVAGVSAAVAAAGAVMIGLGTAIVSISAAFALLSSAAATIGSVLSAVFTALISPIGLVTAAIVAGAAVWLLYTKQGQAAISSMVAFVKPFVKTITDTFAGVTDAIMNGNWALAGKIAMAGLKVVFLQGVGALSSIFGDFAGKFVTQLSGGDFYGAWKTIVLQMSEMWAGFAEGMVAVFTQATRAVIGAWENMTTTVANLLLDLSSSGGAGGAVASTILGVDMSEQDARAEAMRIQSLSRARRAVATAEDNLRAAQRGEGSLSVTEAQQDLDRQNEILNAARGMSGSATTDAKKIVADSVAEQTRASREWLDNLDRGMQQQTNAATAANAANTEGSSSANQVALDAAQAELDRLRKEAMAARQEAAAESERKKLETREAVSNAAVSAAGPNQQGLASRVVGTFSASAFQSLGQMSAAERAAKTLEKIEKLLSSQERIEERQLREMQTGGVFL